MDTKWSKRELGGYTWLSWEVIAMSRNKNKSVNKNKKSKALVRKIGKDDRVLRLEDRKEIEEEWGRLFKLYVNLQNDLENLIDNVGGVLDKYELAYREE